MTFKMHGVGEKGDPPAALLFRNKDWEHATGALMVASLHVLLPEYDFDDLIARLEPQIIPLTFLPPTLPWNRRGHEVFALWRHQDERCTEFAWPEAPETSFPVIMVVVAKDHGVEFRREDHDATTQRAANQQRERLRKVYAANNAVLIMARHRQANAVEGDDGIIDGAWRGRRAV